MLTACGLPGWRISSDLTGFQNLSGPEADCDCGHATNKKLQLSFNQWLKQRQYAQSLDLSGRPLLSGSAAGSRCRQGTAFPDPSGFMAELRRDITIRHHIDD